jgi:Putative DNA-binding domain
VAAAAEDGFFAEIARGEGDRLDFKARFDPSLTGDWCELIKDMIAMANSGGGRIVIGLNDDGDPSGENVAALFSLDPADIGNKIYRYTDHHFTDFAVQRMEVAGSEVAVVSIGGLRLPIIFSVPGEYEWPAGKKKSAFAKGTMYFRHGAKSEPGTTDDLRATLERELERVKGFWLDGIAKVVKAPPEAQVQIVAPTVSLGKEASQVIRLTTKGEGPEFRVVDNDQLYPYRAKELKQRLSEVLGANVASPYDVQCVRKEFGIDENPNFSYKGKFGTRQYSEAFVEWLTEQHRGDVQFFQKVRELARSKMRHST